MTRPSIAQRSHLQFPASRCPATRAGLTAIRLLGGLMVMGPASALTIAIDYAHDAAAENFFGLVPQAKAALNQAALDLGAAITSNLSALTNDYFTASSGGVDVYFDVDLKYTNPSTGVEQVIDMPVIPADTVVIHVGSRALSGSSQALSSLGRAALKLVVDGNNQAGTQAAFIMAATDTEAEWIRGGNGPVYNVLSGPVTVNGAPIYFTADIGPNHGTTWFDSDTNNDGDLDTAAQLASFWHFDHTTLPPAGKFDFYTLALHELTHTLGFGTSYSYTQQLGSDMGMTTWLGPAAVALNGGDPLHLADADLQHTETGLLSTRLSDGLSQAPLMDSVIHQGERRSLTQMDVAFLSDIGWSTVGDPIPEPGGLVGLGAVLAWGRRRSRRAA